MPIGRTRSSPATQADPRGGARSQEPPHRGIAAIVWEESQIIDEEAQCSRMNGGR